MDTIRKRLALIDRQLSRGTDFYKQIFKTSPLIFVAAGLIVGILIQKVLLGFDGLSKSQFIVIWMITAGLCAAITILTIFKCKLKVEIWKLALAALICSVCLGGIRFASFALPAPGDIRNFAGDQRKLATIRGIIITRPYVNKSKNWEFARFKYTDPASSFYLKINEVETVNGWVKAAGVVRVQVAEPVLDLTSGDYIQAYCWLDRFKEPSNPGQFKTKKYLANKNVFIAAYVKSRGGIELLKGVGAGVFPKIKRRFAEATTHALVGDISSESQSRGLLEALLLGYRSNIDSKTYNAFRRTGLLHFISLSGMHLGILVGIIWWVCKTAGLGKPLRAIVCIIAIGVFLLIVPPRAPTLRAAIICLVFCFSFLFRRVSNPLNTLSLAAIILLLARPSQLFEAGWQLSFATVLGILIFSEKTRDFLHDKTNFWFYTDTQKDTPMVQIIKKLGASILTLFSVGFSAWLGGAGVLLYHYHTITPLASIWTILVFPLVSVILTLGFLKIVLFFLLPSAATALGVIVNLSSGLLIWIVKLIARLNISEMLIGKVPVAMIVFYYCVIVFVGFAYFRRYQVKRLIQTAAILTVIVFLGAMSWQRASSGNLILSCLDVGHGQAILIQLPGRKNCLFDAGSLGKSDIGRRVVIGFLNCSGISKIDSVIVSHNNIDHINGIPEIVEDGRVGRVCANDAFFSAKDSWGTAKFLNDSLAKKGIEIQPLNKGLNPSGDVRIKILWPNEEIDVEGLDDNDKSLVCLIEFAGRKILLCSDIEKFAQREILRQYPDLSADILVLPHHGSVKTAEADFIDKLGAGILISSCGQRNYEKQKAIKRGNRVKSFYTARDGAITVRVDRGGEITTESFLKLKARRRE